MFAIILSFFIFSKPTVTQNYTKEELENYQNFLKNQKKLLTDLFRDYDAGDSAIYTLRSSKFVNQTTTIHPPRLELQIQCNRLKLIDVDEKEEKVTFLFDYIAIWKDVRLTWNPDNYGGIAHIYVPQSKIWIPELTLTDVHDILDFKPDEKKDAWIHHDGSAGFYATIVPSVICQLDVFKFPMDSHVCSIDIMYNTYYTNEFLQVFPSVDPIANVAEIGQLGNGEWQIDWINATIDKSDIEVANVMKFVAKIQRNPGFYISLVIIPAYFINALSLIALFLNLNAIPEKLGIGLTNIMAMTFILSILAEDLPKTRKIPLLAIYVIVSLVIVVAAIFSIIILKYLKRQRIMFLENSRIRVEWF
ncbi:unnamed protein product [Caenorhabditis angaria]|uniref:Neurotransmitter-gated ion-channel ligand-binding domain-containing protein n=1 Tax=Caenorhabditis angaria TaxID=860376 RepID=A0A9P1IML0_9PELO|nr:unnamed protein product [Caenorhabditis angaria]